MLVLTGVDEVHDAVGAQGFVTVFGTGDVGGGVEEAAIALLDDDAHGLAILVLELVKEDHGRPSLSTASPLAFRSATIWGSMSLYMDSPMMSLLDREMFRRS